MKKGFTLLELLIVVIAIGILATLALIKFPRWIEKAKAAEAIQIIGNIRQLATAYYNQKGTLVGFNNTMAGIGDGEDLYPYAAGDTAAPAHHFLYDIADTTTTTVKISAKRCTSNNCKSYVPASKNYFINATVDVANNTVQWDASSIYGLY